MLGESRLFLTGSGKPGEIPAASIRAPNHNDIDPLSRSKGKLLRRTKHSVFVLGDKSLHNHQAYHAPVGNDDQMDVIRREAVAEDLQVEGRGVFG